MAKRGLSDALASGELIMLDGAMGTELERRGFPMSDTAWSAAAALTHADIIEQIHTDFIDAGADVISTNTFAGTRYVLDSMGLGEKTVVIAHAGVDAAERARDAADRPVWIAGSISAMAPGLDAKRRPAPDDTRTGYVELIGVLAERGVDCILVEMIRDTAHAGFLLQEAKRTGLPVWAGITCARDAEGVLFASGSHRRPGAPLDEVIGAVVDAQPDLVSIMHTDVEDTAEALSILQRSWNGPVGAYPHSGLFKMPHWDFGSVMSPEAFADFLAQMVAGGVRMVGGCCGIGPAHIRAARAKLAG